MSEQSELFTIRLDNELNPVKRALLEMTDAEVIEAVNWQTHVADVAKEAAHEDENLLKGVDPHDGNEVARVVGHLTRQHLSAGIERMEQANEEALRLIRLAEYALQRLRPGGSPT